MKNKTNKKNAMVIYRASIKTKSGKIIYARDYGHKAFKIVIKSEVA